MKNWITPTFALLLLTTASCGVDSGNLAPSHIEGQSQGRLSCTASFLQAPQFTLSACTDGGLLQSASQQGRMVVSRRGSLLEMTLQNFRTDSTWSGTGRLHFPIGGTGTRSRVMVEAPGIANIFCNQDSLLRCTE